MESEGNLRELEGIPWTYGIRGNPRGSWRIRGNWNESYGILEEILTNPENLNESERVLNPRESNGIQGNPMGTSGIQWNPVESIGVLLNRTESYGIIRIHMESY